MRRAAPIVLALAIGAGLSALGARAFRAAGAGDRTGTVQSAPESVTGPSAPGTGASAPDTQTAGFDSNRAWEHLRQIVAIGPRPAGSAALRQTRAYITRQMSAIGLTVQEQPFIAETPIGTVEMVNLVVRLTGKRPERILITGHYDTKLFREFQFVGASDAGSSAAFLVELARALKDRPRELTYDLVWFDGEEAVCLDWSQCGKPGSPDNTYGSRYYVRAARAANALPSLKAMILVDMIGDRDLRFRREQKSTPWLKDIIWGAARRLGHGDVFADEEWPIEDDHVAFLEAGVPSVDIIDLDYLHWHKATDTLDNVSARSLQIVGDVLLAALPEIEKKLR
jgi:hypothetical protein